MSQEMLSADVPNSTKIVVDLLRVALKGKNKASRNISSAREVKFLPNDKFPVHPKHQQLGKMPNIIEVGEFNQYTFM